MNLIPQVRRYTGTDGVFQLTKSTVIVASIQQDVAQLLAEAIQTCTGFTPAVVAETQQSNAIQLLEHGCNSPDDGDFLPEDYRIKVTAKEILVDASSVAGLGRAIQTIRQLIDIHAQIPCCQIDDHPEFPYRGLMLDVARHFFPVADLYAFIDRMAIYKFNRLHLHLSDDQGWRVEIKRYPKLTSVGSIRPYTMTGHFFDTPRRFDNQPHGGFYTQDELRAVVEFARQRQIVIVPEIDMPGHMQAAIAAYPELGNIPEHQLQVASIWGISRHILSARPEVIEFIKQVLEEILDIFPSKLIHIGGDEAHKEEWEESREAQELIASLGLKTPNELQKYFIGEINHFLQSKGRRIIGWSEIHSAGVIPGTTVMSWLDETAAIKAAQAGADAILAPYPMTYLDYYQADPSHEPIAFGGDLPCEKVYRFHPVPKTLEKQYHRHILGGQGQLWSEYIATLPHLLYMTYPRALALAEKLWLPDGSHSFPDFKSRLDAHRHRPDLLPPQAHPLP